MPSTAGFSSSPTIPSNKYKFRGQHVGGAQYVRNGGPGFRIVVIPPGSTAYAGGIYPGSGANADGKNWDDPALNANVDIIDTTGTTQTYAAFIAAQPQATKLWGGFGDDPGTQTAGAGFAWATPMPT